MMRTQYLIQGPQVSIVRFDHQPDTDHSDADEEVCSDYCINFVERGSFGLATNEQRWFLSSGCVFSSQPGAVHRYSHQERIPTDVCVSVIYSGTFAEEIAQRDPFVPDGFRAVISPANRFAFLKLRLTRLLADGCTFAVEDWASELLSAIRLNRRNADHLYRDHQLRWYAERVEAVTSLFKSRFAESHSLTSVAQSVGMSPFQFARVFSELAGASPHQYLLAIRLDQAAKMIRNGKSVTETCFDVGFANLSHFTRSFQRRFGVAPSSLKPRSRHR
jgi:AraC family transcriptional regulator